MFIPPSPSSFFSFCNILINQAKAELEDLKTKCLEVFREAGELRERLKNLDEEKERVVAEAEKIAKIIIEKDNFIEELKQNHDSIILDITNAKDTEIKNLQEELSQLIRKL